MLLPWSRVNGAAVAKALPELDWAIFLLRANYADRRAAETPDPSVREAWAMIAEHCRLLVKVARQERGGPGISPINPEEQVRQV